MHGPYKTRNLCLSLCITPIACARHRKQGTLSLYFSISPLALLRVDQTILDHQACVWNVVELWQPWTGLSRGSRLLALLVNVPFSPFFVEKNAVQALFLVFETLPGWYWYHPDHILGDINITQLYGIYHSTTTTMGNNMFYTTVPYWGIPCSYTATWS